MTGAVKFKPGDRVRYKGAPESHVVEIVQQRQIDGRWTTRCTHEGCSIAPFVSEKYYELVEK